MTPTTAHDIREKPKYLGNHSTQGLLDTLRKATSLGGKILATPVQAARCTSAMVEFAGGYIAEIHAMAGPAAQ